MVVLLTRAISNNLKNRLFFRSLGFEKYFTVFDKVELIKEFLNLGELQG